MNSANQDPAPSTAPSPAGEAAAAVPHGFLLDVDDPVASPVSRTIAIDSIAADIVRLIRAGARLAFNTGRSAAFLTETVLPALRAAGLTADDRVLGIAEKGAVWFWLGHDDTPQVDPELVVPAAAVDAVRTLVAESFADAMFFDETKLSMISVEQLTAVTTAQYAPRQAAFDAAAADIFAGLGMTTVREQRTDLSRAAGAQWRIDPTIISTDIENVRTGKDLGAKRALDIFGELGPVPAAWRTLGDSRSDYAMAAWLHERGFAVEHFDVRPADGVLESPFPVRTADDPAVVNDAAGALALAGWADEVEAERAAG